MDRNSFQIMITPRSEECLAKTCWDSESSILQTTFHYPQNLFSQTAGNLQEHIDREFGIGNPFYRIVIGEIDIVFENMNRIQSIETRTNTENWLHVSLPSLPHDLASIWTTFQVDYDVNQIAVVSVPVDILWDAQKHQLAFRFNGAHELCQWNALADNVAIRHDNQGFLCEIRFADVVMT